MPKLIDLLKTLGTKSKLDLTKAEFVTVLEAAKDIEVPQDFADQMESGLMTEDAAFNNTKVRSRIQAEVLNGEDTYLNGILADLDLDEASKTELTGEKDTRQRLRKTITTLNEAKKKAKKAGDSTTEEALKLQVTDLNKQLKSIKDTHTSEITKINSDRDSDFVNYKLMNLLGAKQYALPDSMPVDQKIKTALLVVQDALAQKNIKVVKVDGNIKLLNADGTEAYNDKNTLLELPSFLDGALAKTGLLKNSDPAPGNPNNPPIIPGSNGHAPVLNTQMLGELNTQIAAEMAVR